MNNDGVVFLSLIFGWEMVGIDRSAVFSPDTDSVIIPVRVLSHI
jgi:hypothetical protein